MINGIDDLLAAWGPDRVLTLFDQAESPPKKEKTQAQLLVTLAKDAVLFHTPGDEAYARIPVKDHWETWPIKGKGFSRWLIFCFYEKLKKPPGTQALQEALRFLEAKAQFDSPVAAVSTRITSYKDRIYVDLCDEKWAAVEITSGGWRIISDPPVRFRRSKGMLPMLRPIKGGTIAMLRKYLNIGDENNWVLCVCWLIAACRADGPFPILILQGEQGSAKSTLMKILRRIIDPSTALVRTPPREERDLVITATNSWVVAFDNVSGIPPWLSDALCRLATGGGLATRELYTDSDETIFNAMRPVMLNGIDQLAERADLADRAVILNLPTIGDLKRKDEKQLYVDFERELPQILGAVLDAVSGALGRFPEIKLERLPRMADFALWAVAAEQDLGFREGTFMAAYVGNRAEAIEATLEADPVAAAIMGLMEKLEEERKPQTWTGICDELRRCIEDFTSEQNKKTPAWPKTPRAMSSRLRRMVTFLREVGIEVTFLPKSGRGRRLVTVVRTGTGYTAATAATATQDRNDTGDKELGVDATGGGRTPGAADGGSLGDQPPQEEKSANSLNQLEQPSAGGEGGGSGDVIQDDSRLLEEVYI